MIGLRRPKRVYVDDLPRTHDLRFLMLFVVLFVMAFAAIYAVGYVATGDKVPARTRVAGIDIGSLSRPEAAAKLQHTLGKDLRKEIVLVSGEHRFTITPYRAGLRLDVSATMDAVMGGNDWDPRHMVKVVLGGSKVAPVLQVRQPTLVRALEPVSEKLRSKPEQATVTFTGGNASVQPGTPGHALDLNKTVQRIKAAVLEGKQRVRLAFQPVSPVVTSAEAQQFADNVAAPALKKPVTIDVGDATVKVKPSVFGPALRARVHLGQLHLAVNAKKLYQRSHDLLADLPNKAEDARLTWRDGHPVVVDGKDGVSVTSSSWAEAVMRAVGRTSRHATVEVQKVRPDVTAADLRDLGIDERLAEAGVPLPADSAYLPGVAKAASQLNGAVIRPGHNFSFLSRVDTYLDSDTLSLVATATYAASMRAGLVPVEVAAPVHHDPRLPVGLDARVVTGGQDLVLRNEADTGVYVHAALEQGADGGTLVVDLWGTKQGDVDIDVSDPYNKTRPETEHRSGKQCRPRPGEPGFEVDMTQTVSKDGSEVRTVSLHSTYRPLSKVVCGRR